MRMQATNSSKRVEEQDQMEEVGFVGVLSVPSSFPPLRHMRLDAKLFYDAWPTHTIIHGQRSRLGIFF